jgi:hypothetical protein
VALLQAAKAGDRTQTAKASAAWYANANQIAAFLHTANPHAWSRTDPRAMMKTHLDETLAEAQHRLQGDYAADVRDYDAVHRHILAMADTHQPGDHAPVPTALPLMARVPGGACRPATQPGLGPSLRRGQAQPHGHERGHEDGALQGVHRRAGAP